MIQQQSNKTKKNGKAEKVSERSKDRNCKSGNDTLSSKAACDSELKKAHLNPERIRNEPILLLGDAEADLS